MTPRKQCLADIRKLIYIWTHSDHGNTDKTCTSSHQIGSQNWEEDVDMAVSLQIKKLSTVDTSCSSKGKISSLQWNKLDTAALLKVMIHAQENLADAKINSMAFLFHFGRVFSLFVCLINLLLVLFWFFLLIWGFMLLFVCFYFCLFGFCPWKRNRKNINRKNIGCVGCWGGMK